MNYEESFDKLLDNLCDEHAPLRAALIYRLSEPLPDELTALEARWNNIPVERRQLLLSRLAEMSETSFEVDFTAVALFALKDEDDAVRSSAIEALWASDHPDIMHRLITLLRTDEATSVRAAAASALGRFVLASELGEISEALGQQAEAALLEAWEEHEDAPEVQRRALESIAFSSRDEVPSLIEEAAEHYDLKMQASALLAMGRSADERWASYVLQALENPEPELRFEAARAAGELSLTDAVRRLIELVDDEDLEIQETAIWSLGEIGGPLAQRALMALADREDIDDALLETIEDALNVAMLGSGEFATFILRSSDDDLEDLDDFQDDEFSEDDADDLDG